eukprot:jgi/Picsp_1/2676/NSC_00906-R1_vacuolar protein sorting-associated protein 18 homolog
MTLLDEWNQEIDGVVAESGETSATVTSKGILGDDSIFSLDLRLDFVSLGRGHVVAFACSNGKIFIATSKNYLIRHDTEVGQVDEVQVSSAHDCKTRRLFVDPFGNHVLLLVQNGPNLETLYVESKFERMRSISKLRGVCTTSVAWAPMGRECVDVAILGTDKGHLILLDMHNMKREYLDNRVQVSGAKNCPIAGLACIKLFASEKEQKSKIATGILLLVLCGTHLHMIKGYGSNIVQMIENDIQNLKIKSFDLPIEQDAAQLQLLRPTGLSTGATDVPDPTSFAVLSTSGVYYGNINTLVDLDDPLDHLESHKLLTSSLLNASRIDRPISLCLTQHHIILLYATKIQFINHVSKEIVQEIKVDEFASPIGGASALPLGLCHDILESQILVLAGDDIYEIDYTMEDKYMWKIYLAKGEYPTALLYCRTPAQRNAAYLQEAERLFAEHEYTRAAELFGKCTLSKPTFEETALKFVQAGSSNAVMCFLRARLSTLGSDSQVQRTMVSTWLLELLLDKTNREQLNLQNYKDKSLGNKENEAIKEFLMSHNKDLDPQTTKSLLESYGRDLDLVYYAKARGDNEAELDLLIRQGDAERALDVLRKPSIDPTLLYKYASSLMAIAPSQTIYSWIEASPPLDPLKLLPALLPFSDPEASHSARREVMRYIKFSIEVRGVMDVAIHDLNIALLSCDSENEEELVKFLRKSRNSEGNSVYDGTRALRLCQTRQRTRATIFLMSQTGMWKEAVEKALDIDFVLAKSIASMFNGKNHHLRKDLWLIILDNLLSPGLPEAEGDQIQLISSVEELLQDSNGAVDIDDVLPHFSDFEQVGVFKKLVCSSLHRYTKNLEHLKSDVTMASLSNSRIRGALSRVSSPEGFVNPSKVKCLSCGRSLSQKSPPFNGITGGALPAFYLFASGNGYHGSCLCSERLRIATLPERGRIKSLWQELVSIGDSRSPESIDSTQRLLDALNREVAEEDPFCGEVVCQLVMKPFLCSGEEENTWSIL